MAILIIKLQGGEYQEYPDLEEMMRRSDRLREENIRVFKIVQEQCFKEMRLWNEEWDDFEKVVRYSGIQGVMDT